MEMTTLPIDKVRFDGDPVACVVAADRYVAEDAAELVEVMYEVLPAVMNMFKAMEDGAALVDDALPTNLVSSQRMSTEIFPTALLKRMSSWRRHSRNTDKPTFPWKRVDARRYGMKDVSF